MTKSLNMVILNDLIVMVKCAESASFPEHPVSGSGEGGKKSIHIKIMILISVITKLWDGTKKMELIRKSTV